MFAPAGPSQLPASLDTLRFPLASPLPWWFAKANPGPWWFANANLEALVRQHWQPQPAQLLPLSDPG